MSSLKCAVFLLFSFLSSHRCDYFTSLVDMEKLLYTERELTTILGEYLSNEERRLQEIRGLFTQFNELHQMVGNNEDSFLSNPINAYLLIKRLTQDWRAGERLVHSTSTNTFVRNIQLRRKDLHFPRDEDLKGAAMALMRLQDTYKLNTTTLANGQIEGTKPSQVMTAGDCYELGVQAYNGDDFHHTSLWMQEALKRLNNEKKKTANIILIMEYIAISVHKLGNSQRAVELTENIIKLAPKHQRALNNLKYYQQASAEQEESKKENTEPKVTDTMDQYVQKYKKLCRGESVERLKEVLSCRYFTNNNPVLFLQPVKEEELHLNPRIVVYHDILSEKEMYVIKSLAQPKLIRATVRADGDNFQASRNRTSKSAWLTDEDDDAIYRVSQRIGDITGLDMSSAENLQVVNYGIGGHYEPHYDFFSGHDFKVMGVNKGNRIATWLNYMSDVDAGGATVFPILGVRVKPQKGSAVFWYNLLRSGLPDGRTLHAACPVLAGSKWVSNKWIHEYGQEFRRQCSLKELE